MKRTLAFAAILALGAQLGAQDPRYNQFLEKFTKALEFDDAAGIDKLVRADPAIVLAHFKAICWDWKLRGDDANRKTLDALAASWGRIYKTRTLDKYERYISSRSEHDRTTIYNFEQRERKIYALYREAEGNKDRGTFKAAADGAQILAGEYGQIGYALHSAKMWSLCAEVTRKLPDLTLDDRKAAIAAAESFVKHRKAWEWTEDSLYKLWVNWLKSEKAQIAEADAGKAKRESEGYSADAKGADALVMPKAEEVVADLRFAALKEPIQDHFWMGGVAPPLWMGTQVVGAGPSKIPFFSRRDIFLTRPSANKYGITIVDKPNAQGEPIAPSIKFKPSVFHLDDNKKFPYAMWFYACSDQEPLGNLNHNLAPQAHKALLYYKSASSWTAEIDGEPITFYDDNSNGELFEEDVYKMSLMDLASGSPKDGVKMANYDSMRVGKKGVTQPYSQFVKVGEHWYHIRSAGDNKVGVRPLNPEYVKYGSVKMKWKGARNIKPYTVVIEGEGAYYSARFNIASGKEIEVPTGKYNITFGRILSGKGSRAMQAQITRGSAATIEVAAGKTTTIELGAPFKLDYTPKKDGDNMILDSSTFVVRGKYGEVYSMVNNVMFQPEVVVARSKNGRGAKPSGEFKQMDIDQLNALWPKWEKVQIKIVFWPVPKGAKDSFEMKVAVPKNGVVGLRQNKHKLFKRLVPVFH